MRSGSQQQGFKLCHQGDKLIGGNMLYFKWLIKFTTKLQIEK